MFHASRLYKVYGKYYHVLRDLSFTVERGEVALFLGKVGSGKTTLFRLLNSLESIDAGSLELDAHPISFKQLNKKNTIGYVSTQYNILWHLTVEKNVTIALQKAAGLSKKKAQERAHIILGYYSLLGQKDMYVVSLSPEQQQRLALVRVLALDPTIICWDDPTGNIDPILTPFIAQMIQSLAFQDYIVLVTTRDIALFEKLYCTAHLIYRGRIAESSLCRTINTEDHPLLSAFIKENKPGVKPQPEYEW
jgi:ABC-type polar amino acid transport system ATPase subunit